MIDNLVYVVKVLLPGLILSIVTAILTVRLSLRRFYAERWWERKVEAYTSIFESLYRLKHYCNIKYEQDCDFDTKPISKEQGKELEKQWADANMEIGKAIDIGSFVVCDDAVSCLRDFRKRPRLDYEDHPIFELAAQESEYLDECISRLKTIAKKDLKLKR